MFLTTAPTAGQEWTDGMKMAEFFADGHLRFLECEWRDDNGDVVEIAPVVHGLWKRIEGMAPPECHGRHMCSNCYARALDRKFHEELSDYCPNCGAKMDEEG